MLITGKIHSIETSNNEILILLDQFSGIDYIRENKEGLQGIGARVQFGYPYNTFTIRTKRYTNNETEYEKRLRQISQGYIYPAFTLQAYFDDRNNMDLISMAIIKTKELYEYIDRFPEYTYKNKSDNEFIFIKWDDLKNCFSNNEFKVLIK